MRNKNILKVLSLIAAVCIAAGCNGSAIAETTTTTAKQTTIVSTTTKPLEEKINPTGNSEQPLFQKEFEITDWTMEDLVADMTICGHKFTLPYSCVELGDNFNIEGMDYSSIRTLYYSDEQIANVIYYDNISNISRESKFHTIYFGGLNDEIIPSFNVNGITQSSTKIEVSSILGMPNSSIDDGNFIRDWYYFDEYNMVFFMYDKNNNCEIKIMTIVNY